MTKKAVGYGILKAYEHNADEEGDTISKRRLWYILKPLFAAADLSGIFDKTTKKPVLPISNADFNKWFNDLAKVSVIDDTYILDNSRVMSVGSRLPHIILASEKKTIETTTMKLAERFGCSAYICGGFSSIYAAKKLLDGIDTEEPITVLMLSDHDKSGYHIQDTVSRHFGGARTFRTLINPVQIEAYGKEDQFFDVDPKYGKTYELDVLNLTELSEAFIDAVPPHIAVEILESYEAKLNQSIMDDEVWQALQKNQKLSALLAEYLEEESRLRRKYESAFLVADPITIKPFGLTEVYDDTVDYLVDKWM